MEPNNPLSVSSRQILKKRGKWGYQRPDGWTVLRGIWKPWVSGAGRIRQLIGTNGKTFLSRPRLDQGSSAVDDDDELK